MLFAFLVLGIGLAYYRWQDVTFSSGMLLSFAIWVLLGLAQRLREVWSLLDEAKTMPRERRCGLFAELIVLAWSLALLGIVSVVEIARRYGLTVSGRELAHITFFLAILGAYWQPSPQPSSLPRRTRLMRTILTAVLLTVGALWLAEIIHRESQIFQMIHAAIRKVESAQPTTWNGQPFDPEPLALRVDDLQSILNRLSDGLVLAMTGVAAAGLMLCFWRLGRRWRFFCSAIWLSCLAGAASYLWVCWNIGPADLSPLHVAPLYSLRWTEVLMPSLLLITLISGASFRFAGVAQIPAAGTGDVDNVNPIHEHPAVVAFGLCAILTGIGQNTWENAVGMNSAPVEFWIGDPRSVWYTLSMVFREYAFFMPAIIIHFAAALMLARQLWRYWRRSPRYVGCWSLAPGEFITAWIVLLLTLVVALPIAVWWGLIASLV